MLTPTLDIPRPKPFTFNPPIANPLGQKWLGRIAPAVEKLFALDALNDLYDRCARPGEENTFLDRVLDELGINYRLANDDLARIPKTGPMIVVANHPFGALDGIILAAILNKVRPDVKVMANFLLGRIPDLRDRFLLVDPFANESSARENIRPLRQAMCWLRDGGLLAVFPAGEVAHADLRTRHVEEPAWSSTIARIARKAKVPVLPLYFHGRNSNIFQVMGLVHSALRTAMLPRELFKKRGARIDVRVGSPLPHRKLAHFSDDQQLADFLRQRTLLLAHRPTPPLGFTAAPAPVKPMTSVADPVPAALLCAEVAALPPCQLLSDAGDLLCFHASATQIPHLLREIGRLREITYRATGEGTGKPLDLDPFDTWYTHLFVWNKSVNQIVGGYRLGCTDDIIRERGAEGLYTSTLFNYLPGFLDQLGPAIELGRSFIRSEYQRSFSPLLLLWKAISAFVLQRPHCKTLFGPVSISNDYQTVSKHVMVRFLDDTHGNADLARLTRPRHPFRPPGMARLDKAHAFNQLLRHGDTVDDMVCDLEPDGKGMPVLIRQYLKLGARFFAFNVDPDFSDALDALMTVDLTQTDRKTLTRYMGIEGTQAFFTYHGVTHPSPP